MAKKTTRRVPSKNVRERIAKIRSGEIKVPKPVGRPTSCDEKFLEMARDYLENFDKYGDVIPMIAGLACATGVWREMIHDWGNYEGDCPTRSKFSYIYREIMSAQEKTLLNGGLTREFDAKITGKIMAKHGYHDAQPPQALQPINNNYTIEVVSPSKK